MRDTSGPHVEYVPKQGSDRWKIWLRNFPHFRDGLGIDVLNGFGRCFVASDRLTSMISFIYISQERYGRDSIAFGRDLHTGVWFTI